MILFLLNCLVALFAQFHETTRLPCLYLLFGLGLIFLAILITGFGARAITNLIGFAYPLYRSLRAIKTSDKNDDTQWLMYWVIFGFFSLFESFTDFALGWLPLYFFGKIGFLLFCMLPQTQGAKLVFTNFLDPMILSPLENFGSEKDFLNSENKRE